MFKIKDLRNKILFVFLMLFIYKIGTYIPVPGINADLLSSMQKDSGLLGIANMFSGGALSNFSIFAMGVMPYITASIVIQLLALDVIPKLTEWNKQGEQGRKKIKVLTRYVTVVLGFAQAYGMSYSFHYMYSGLVSNPVWTTFLMIAAILTVGTIILMVMAELIDKKGIGNGMSILIFSGIMMAMPQSLYNFYLTEFSATATSVFFPIVKTVIIGLLILLLIIAIIYFQKSERRIPIQYANKMTFNNPRGMQNGFLPIKLNSAGVIPVIFAVSLIMLPSTIARFFNDSDVATWIINHVTYQSPIGMVFYALMIIFFTYFYSFIQVNPEKLSQDLKKSGGFVPGIRPGKETELYISKILKRVTFMGALFLALLAIFPMLLSFLINLPTQIQIGGVSLIIVVSVGLDTLSKIQSMMVERSYRGFIK